MAYRNRAIEPIIQRLEREVVVLEGARAVGKTTVAKHLVEQGKYKDFVSFGDRETRRAAESDIDGWLRTLQLPAVIDEAQLVADLPMAIKTYVDELGLGRYFLLTGSAELGRKGLGGADPLTRRATRLTLHPFTAAELHGNPGSLVDALFEGLVAEGPIAAVGQVERSMRFGGFPRFALRRVTAANLQRDIYSDVDALLTDDVLPGRRYDLGRARGVLDAILVEPGGLLNTSSLADKLGTERRTVEDYIDLLERRFLIWRMPNLASGPKRPARPKLHPTDSSLSVEALRRSGIDIDKDRSKFGQVFESWVVQQLLAAKEWSELHADLYFWRKASGSTPEVDAVLKDDRGRHVAIEVKSSTSVDRSDTRGIRTFARENELHRGFVIYQGERVIRLDDSIWALPVSALTDHSMAFTIEDETKGHEVQEVVGLGSTNVEPVRGDASLFVSYVHSDDAYLDGAITQFVRQLGESYEFQFDDSLEIFLDRDSLIWGQRWEDEIDRNVERTSLFLAIITPRYFRSEACRNEFNRFSKAQAMDPGRNQLLLPMVWADLASVRKAQPNDPILKEVDSTQYVVDFDIRNVPPSSIEYRRVVEDVAARLYAAIAERESRGTRRDDADLVDDDSDGLIDMIQRVEDLTNEITEDLNDLGTSVQAIGEVFTTQFTIADDRSPQAVQRVLLRAGGLLRAPAETLEGATAKAASSWQELEQVMASLVSGLRVMNDREGSRTMKATFDDLASSFDLSELDEVSEMLDQMSAMSRHLRPTARSVKGAISIFSGMKQSAVNWSEELGRI